MVAGCLDEEEERFFCVFDAGRRGHVCESWPTNLHLGQALSEPGHDAMTLKPKRSKNRDADSDVPAGSLRTKSQWLVRSVRPLYR